jgi:hypothetical protein
VAVRATALVAWLAVVGCLPRERINSACRWTDEAGPLAPSGAPARRAHLVEDVRVAKDLGIRYADTTAGRMNTPAWRTAQTSCTERLLAEIVRVHQVSSAELTAAAGVRELWVDLLAVLLPVGILFAAASRVVTTRVVTQYDRNGRGVAAVVCAVLTPLGGGMAVVLAQMWGVVVEQLRLRDEHISYRAFDLPASRHGWLLWVIAMVLFAAIGAMELHRQGTPTGRRSAFKDPTLLKIARQRGKSPTR